MKYILIAAIALLALAQGNHAQDATDVARIFEDFKTKITSQASELINNPDIAIQAKNFINDRREQLEPLATQLQEQLSALATTLGEHAANTQTEFKSIWESMIQKLSAPAIEN